MPRNRHGLEALKVRVNVRGFGAIDRRTVAARSLVQWREEMLRDLGGEAALSAQQRRLVEMAVRSALFLDHIDAWLLEQPSLVVIRRRAILPVLRDRQRLADDLLRNLQALGLDKRTAPPSLASHLAGRRTDRVPPSAAAGGTPTGQDEPRPADPPALLGERVATDEDSKPRGLS